jgi:hypothetical protein
MGLMREFPMYPNPKLSAKEQLTNQAAAITNANLTIEAALSSAATTSEKIELLNALRNATSLYLREVLQQFSNEQEAELRAAAEKKLRDRGMSEDEARAVLNRRNRPDHRGKPKRQCLNAAAMVDDDDDEGDLVGELIEG